MYVSQRQITLAAMKRVYGPKARVRDLDALIRKHPGTLALAAAIDVEVKRA